MSAQLAADIVVNVLRHFLTTEKKAEPPKEDETEVGEQSNSPAALRGARKPPVIKPPEPKKEEAGE